MTTSTSSDMFKSEEDRVRMSRLLLVALVENESLTLDQVKSQLRVCLGTAREFGSTFLFDLGWGEDPATALKALWNLNWISSTESPNHYRATSVGIDHLKSQIARIEVALGAPMDRIRGSQ